MTGTLRLFGSSNANAIGRHARVSPVSMWRDRSAYPAIAGVLTLIALIVPAAVLATPPWIAATCAAVLLGGLPHGALDLAVMRRAARQRTLLVVGLYLGLAALMFATWHVAPSLALALFLAMAMAHFAEDWSAAEHPFFAHGIAVATLSASALFHREAVGGLFVLLTGDQAATGLADALMMVAPAAVICAVVAIALLWNGGHRVIAGNAAGALAAMILLPPLAGFAIYFCLIHSPTHVEAGLRRLGPMRGVRRMTTIATLGGLAIAVAIAMFLPIAEPSSRLFAASFMTLSILTLPHMAVPFLLRLMPQRAG